MLFAVKPQQSRPIGFPRREVRRSPLDRLPLAFEGIRLDLGSHPADFLPGARAKALRFYPDIAIPPPIAADHIEDFPALPWNPSAPSQASKMDL